MASVKTAGRVAAALLSAWLAAARAASPPMQGAAGGLAEYRQGGYAEALQIWQAAADSGDAQAALYIGVLFDSGEGVPHDEARALVWYRRAAELGSATAAFNVGVMYDAGRAVAADPRIAADWYRRAAQRHYARADYNLGLLYEAGIGVPASRVEAARLFQAAARLGLTAARQHLAALGYRTGPVAPKADDAAMADFARAQQALLDRTQAGAIRAVVLFRQAAVQNNVMAQYDLGYCYANGIGVAPDRNQAAQWYARAIAGAKDPMLRQIAQAALAAVTPAPR